MGALYWPMNQNTSSVLSVSVERNAVLVLCDGYNREPDALNRFFALVSHGYIIADLDPRGQVIIDVFSSLSRLNINHRE